MPTFNGTPANDTLDGSSGADSIYGLGGADRILTGNGDDYVEGGDGDDEVNAYPVDSSGRYSYFSYSGKKRIYGNAGNDFLFGGTDSDSIYGGDGNDTLFGFDGSDILYGDAGNDTLYGEKGNDSLDGGDGNDGLFGEAGDDSLLGGVGSDTLDGGDGNDTLDGGFGDDTIRGGAGDDRYFGGEGNDYLSDVGGNNYFDGGLGNDTIFGDMGADTVLGGAGNDSVIGWGGNDSIDGGGGNDTLSGGDGNDTLQGGEGDDSLRGGAGTNLLQGGNGNDSLLSLDTGNDTLLGGNGNDRLDAYTGLGTKLLDGGAGEDTLYGGNGSDSLIGSEGDDELFGYAGNDSLDGGLGHDALYGGEGNDTLVGADGADELYGGAGDDVYYIGNQTQNIYDSGGADTAYVSASFVKVPSSIEKVIYTGGAVALPYWIDALLPDAASGLRFRTLLDSSKTIGYAFPIAPPSYITNPDLLKGWAPFSAVQQSRAVTALRYVEGIVDLRFLVASDAAAKNAIVFASNDQIGSAAYAFFPSGTPTGSDLYLDNSNQPNNVQVADGTYGALTLIHELGHSLGLKHPFSAPDADGDIEDPPYLSASEDSTKWTVMSYNDSSAEYYLRFSVLDIAALQYLYGPSKTARTANDTYSISTTGTNFIWDGAGADTITAAACNQGCTIYLTPGYWGYVGSSKAAYITGPGQITVNFGTTIENLIGSGYADTLVGNEVGNAISGGAGNDTITGGAGNDTLDGGDGADVAVFSGPLSAYSLLTLGSDEIRLTDSAMLRDGVDIVNGFEIFRFADGDRTKAQILALAVPPGVNWVGTLGDDTYVGGAGNDTISGLAGNDSLNGGSGNDSLIGGAGNDTLDGGTGADSLLGGLGDDTYVVDDLLDTVTELAGEGKDTVQTTLLTYILGSNVENWIALGAANLSADGNTLNNVLTGNAGNNTIYGGGGDDTMLGGEGSDLLIIGAGRSLILGGGGADTLRLPFDRGSITDAGFFGTDGVILRAPGAEAMFSNIELLNFTDRTVAYSDFLAQQKKTPVITSTGNPFDLALLWTYKGPVTYLQFEHNNANANSTIYGTKASEFLKASGVGSKAINGGGGNDVIDGGVGSNFLTGGGSAQDKVTFYLDGRAAGESWSTITDFKLQNDFITIWGWRSGVSSIKVDEIGFNNAGAKGFEGLTIRFLNLLPDNAPNSSLNPFMNSITLTGYTLEQLGAKTLQELATQISSGQSRFFRGGTVEGQGYLQIGQLATSTPAGVGPDKGPLGSAARDVASLSTRAPEADPQSALNQSMVSWVGVKDADSGALAHW